MLNATVSLSKWSDPCPLKLASSCRQALLLCLPLFHGGVVLHLDMYHQPPGCTEQIQGRLLKTQAAFFCYRSRQPTALPQRPLCGFPKNTLNRQCNTHLTVCYYRCTVLYPGPESASGFNVPKCTPEWLIHTLDSSFCGWSEAQHTIV